MKIVIDTIVIASAVFFGGKPRQLLELLFQRKVDAYASPEILLEYQETFDYLIEKYPGKHVTVPMAQIARACIVIEPVTDIHVSRDPDDDKFISCAVDGKCMYIVSGDKDLLSVGQYEDIEIVSVADFFKKYRNR